MTTELKTNSNENGVAKENKRLKEEIKQYSEVINECRLHEKRLMYLIYLSIEKGYPIDKIYEEKVSMIKTERFQKLIDWEENVRTLNTFFTHLNDKAKITQNNCY